MPDELRALFVSLAATSLALPIAYVVLRRADIMDHPNVRSSHFAPTPRGAGLALAIGLAVAWVASGATSSVPLAGVLILAALGFADDLRNLTPVTRLWLQFGVAAVVSYSIAGDESEGTARPLLLMAAIALMIAIVNATNFMDGVNGLSATHGTVFGFVYWTILAPVDASLSSIAAALVGTSVAFLPWNWGRSARLFMGDSGSYLIGGLVAVLSVATSVAYGSLIIGLAPVWIYLVDVSTTLVRRYTRRRPLLQAHRDHVYQQLLDHGLSPMSTTMVVSAFSALCGAVAVEASRDHDQGIMGWTLLIALGTAYTAIPRFVKGNGRQSGKTHGS